MKTITGKIVFKDLGPGCWGIVDDAGNEYRAVDMPEQLKHEGKRVQVGISPADEAASIFMWGKPVDIISFGTLIP